MELYVVIHFFGVCGQFVLKSAIADLWMLENLEISLKHLETIRKGTPIAWCAK